MSSVSGKGNGGRRNEAAARNGKRVGRPPKFMRVPVLPDAVWVALPADAVLLAQQLMLRDWPDVTTIEELIPYALRQLAP